jgi:hypothetical protein
MRRRLLAPGALITVMALAAMVPAAVGGQSQTLLKADSMTGVPKALTGSTAIRGVPGGGLPWVVGPAKVVLTKGGWLEVKVQDVVFDPTDPTVIERGIGNTNPVAAFRAIVSCVDSSGATVNVQTPTFPATTGLFGGDARFEGQVDLPSPCIAPIVFVGSGGGSWFVTTGG